jgi:S-adenosylhomocysteine hydrolase
MKSERKRKENTMFWFTKKYPLLTHVMEMYRGVDLSNVLLLACQHLLEPQLRMFEILFKMGLKPENCIVAGKGYSTSHEILQKLRRSKCFIAPFSQLFDPFRNFDDWYEEEMDAYLDRFQGRLWESYRKVIVLDDGGFMHFAADKAIERYENVVGIEQTSSGHHKIQAAHIRFDTHSVARSKHKLTYESPLIGRIAVERILRHLRMRGKSDPNILVFGLGPIGRQIAGRLFVEHRFRGVATDLKGDSWDILGNKAGEFLANERRIVPRDEALSRLEEFDVIVGATGSPVLSSEDVEALHPCVSLISASSSDREFPALSFRKFSGRVHDDYYLGRQCLVNAGFPITFDGKPHAMPPEEIEFTIALLLIHLLDEASDAWHPLPLVVEQVRSLWNPQKDAERWYKSFKRRSLH